MVNTAVGFASYVGGGGSGPFFDRCAAPRRATPFSGVGVRRCRPTFLRNVGRRRARISTVVGGPRAPAFRGAVITVSCTNSVLSQMTAIFFGLGDTRASSRVRTLTRGLSPVLARRSGGMDLGRGLFTHIGTMCRAASGDALAARRRHLLRGSCSDFTHGKTGLDRRSGTGCHRLAARLDGAALTFNRGVLGTAGDCTLGMASSAHLGNVPRSTLRTTTRATGRGNRRK